MQTSRWSESILAAHDGFGSRLCENVRFQEVLGIIFRVMPPRPMLGAMLFFIAAKSRWKFYFSKEHPSFRTAWVINRRPLHRSDVSFRRCRHGPREERPLVGPVHSAQSAI